MQSNGPLHQVDEGGGAVGVNLHRDGRQHEAIVCLDLGRVLRGGGDGEGYYNGGIRYKDDGRDYLCVQTQHISQLSILHDAITTIPDHNPRHCQ
jgi:hypothetical protein